MMPTHNILKKLDHAIIQIKEFGDKLYQANAIRCNSNLSYLVPQLLDDYEDVNFVKLSKEAFVIQEMIENGDYFTAISKIRSFYPYFDNDILVKYLELINVDVYEEINALYTIVDILKDGEYFKVVENNIPNNINDLTEDVLSFFSEYPEFIYEINSRMFEYLTALIFKKFGMNVELTKQTRDGGYDILAIHDVLYTKHRYIIECKKYKKERKVDVGTVRSLYGIKNDLMASKVFLVTTSGYSQDAINFAKKHSWELELKDFNDIIRWLKIYWGKKNK